MEGEYPVPPAPHTFNTTASLSLNPQQLIIGYQLVDDQAVGTQSCSNNESFEQTSVILVFNM